MSEDFDKRDQSENADAFRELAMKKNLQRIEPMLSAILNRIRLASLKGEFSILVSIWRAVGQDDITGNEIESLSLELINRGFILDSAKDVRVVKRTPSFKSITSFGRGISRPKDDSRYLTHYRIRWGR